MSGLLKALGVRIRRVPDLDEGWLYVEDAKALFLDFELTDEAIDYAKDRVLLEVFHLSTS